MLSSATALVLPATQRRTLADLAADLHLRGDPTRQSAFWLMLTLSAVIASAGVLADSTATVIGAMIIAPLSTPIMGIAVEIVRRSSAGSVWYVLLGAILVVAVGIAFSLAVPGSYHLLDNSQVAGRTSPGLVDLVAAMATGVAGAVALSRRDVAAVLPGVAIAISLVPPLAVVGVCLGHGEVTLAAGAGVLFLSNLLALVLAGVVVFSMLYLAATGQAGRSYRPDRRMVSFLVLLGLAVAVPLATNTVASYLVARAQARTHAVAVDWLSETPGAEVVDVEFVAHTARIEVRTPSRLPPLSDLTAALSEKLPGGVRVVVETNQGRRIEAGELD